MLKELKLKYGNLGKIPSIVGSASHSAQAGDIVWVLTRWTLLNTKNSTDQDIVTARNQIYGMLAEHIFPCFLKAFSNKTIPDDFALYAVYVEMHADEQKNRILINEDTKFSIYLKLKEKKKIKHGDPVNFDEIEEFMHIEKNEDVDPNAATIMLVLNKHGWFGKADLIYNRKNVQAKINRAMDFFKAAKDNLEASNVTAFYQSLWDCAELLAESLLLLHNQIKLKTHHNTIQEIFEKFCNSYNLDYIKSYKKISELRNNARYGPPHPNNKNQIKDAPPLLQDITKMHKFVLRFLQDREIKPTQSY